MSISDMVGSIPWQPGIGDPTLFGWLTVRAASFYAVPLPALSQLTNGLRITWLLEILGASCIALAAMLNLRRRNVS